MKKRSTATKDVKPRRWLSIVLMTACGAVLVTGFFLAGQQHFTSMDYGMKNSRLRKQIDELEAEKRRLLHAREVSLSPAEIKRVAKKAGLSDASAPMPELARAVTPERAKAVPASAASAATKPTVVKTAAVSSSAATPVTAAYIKSDKSEKVARRQMHAE